MTVWDILQIADLSTPIEVRERETLHLVAKYDESGEHIKVGYSREQVNSSEVLSISVCDNCLMLDI